MKRVVLLILCAVLIFSALGETESITPEERFERALLNLANEGSYYKKDNVGWALDGVAKEPTVRFYLEYTDYLTALLNIHGAGYSPEDTEYGPIARDKLRLLGEAQSLLDRIKDNEDFLSDLGERKLPLPEELTTYINGLMEQARGHMNEALDAFETVRGVFDASGRADSLIKQKELDQYAEAKRLFDAGDYAGAAKLYRQLYSRNKYSMDENGDFAEDLYNDCREMAVKLGINIENGTEAPAPSDANSGHWSSWSVNKPSGNAKTETKTQYRSRSAETQYRYRTLTRKTTKNQVLKDATLVSTKKEYGSWSSWKDSKVSKSATREVETRKVNVTEKVKQYRYSVYTYIGTDGYEKYAAIDYHTSPKYARDGKWVYSNWLDQPRKKTEDVYHAVNKKYYPMYGKYWFNEETREIDKVVGSKTQYRYRDITVVRVYDVWSDWSAWQNDAVSASSKTQVETKNAYSPWSGWTDDEMTGSYDTQVETRTVYRYWIKE